MIDSSRRLAWARIYQLTAWALAAFLPLYAAAGAAYFAALRQVRYVSFFELGLACGVVLAMFLGVVAYQGYRRTRSRFLFYAAMGYMAFAVLYLPRAVLAPMVDPQSIHVFNPAARLVLTGYLFAGLRYLGADSLEPKTRPRRSWAPHLFMMVVLGLGLLAFGFHYQMSSSDMASLEWVCVLAASLTAFRLLMARVRTVLMTYQLLALLMLAQAAFIFTLAEPWDTLWWLAHGVTLASFISLGYAVCRSYEAGRSFSGIYDETVYYKEQAERLRRTTLNLREEIDIRRQAEENLRLSRETELEARAETERLYKEAQEAGRIKDDFLATLSHELRTPVNVIHGFAEILRDELPTSGRAREAADAIYRNAKMQVELTSDLLDMSRIITGQLTLHAEPIELPALVNQVVAGQSLAASARGITVATDYDPCVGEVNADPVRVAQIVWNLLSNAVKFTQPGGHIDVRIRRERHDAKIIVQDTGQGIDLDFLPNVFDRFRQQDSSRTRRHGGLGLGLSIVRQLVELHGGSVEAMSKGPGKGATFTVSLPMMAVRLPPAEQRAKEPRAGEAGDGRTPGGRRLPLTGFNILVVDDSGDVRLLVGTVLKSQGATVREAASAAQALEMLKQNRPDVLLSDISMPEEDGYELIRKVRALEHSAADHIPAAALTAFARDEERDRALEAGFEMHMAKPVEAARLIRAVAQLAQAAQRRAQ